MAVLFWVTGGIISGFCCTWITGFRMSKGIRRYLEYGLIGGLGGVIGAVVTQNVIILFTYIFGYLYHIVGFFFDGALTFAIIQLVLISLFLRYLHPAARKHLGTSSFLAILLVTLVLSIILLVTFFLRTPIEDAYFALSTLKLNNADPDIILVNIFAPIVGGWTATLLSTVIFQVSSTTIVITPASSASLLSGLLVILKNYKQTLRPRAYLRIGDHLGPITSISWSRDGKYIVSVSSMHICVSEGKTGLTVYSCDPVVIPSTVIWASQGIHLVSTSQPVKVTDMSSKEPFRETISEHTTSLTSNNISPVWSPNGKYIAFVEGESEINLCDAQSGQSILRYGEHTDRVLTIAWSPDGTSCASGGKDNTVHVWDAVTGRTIIRYEGNTDAIQALAWSPDSTQLASGSIDKTIHIWGAKTGENVQICKGHTAPVCAIAWSPDGKRIASGGQDNTVRIWDISTGKAGYTHIGHTRDVVAIQWAPDGTLIASGSTDATVHIWRVPKV